VQLNVTEQRDVPGVEPVRSHVRIVERTGEKVIHQLLRGSGDETRLGVKPLLHAALVARKRDIAGVSVEDDIAESKRRPAPAIDDKAGLPTADKLSQGRR